MKKIIAAAGYTLFACVLLLPVLTVGFSWFGYQFELANVPALAIAAALLSLFLADLSICGKTVPEYGGMRVIFALLTPFSVIHAFACMFAHQDVWTVISVFVCMGACLVLTIKYGKPSLLKKLAVGFFVIMILPAGLLGFWTALAGIAGPVGKDTVVKSIESPNGRYYVEVIASSQGALGGDTLVDVYTCEDRRADTFAFKIAPKPKRIYYGEWGEFEHMEIHWEGDTRLVIDSVVYAIE